MPADMTPLASPASPAFSPAFSLPLAGPSRARMLALTALAGALTIPLGGCGSDGDFPSLARRPAELGEQSATQPGQPAGTPGRVAGSGMPAPAAPDATASEQAVPADLSGRLAELERSAREAHARFAAARGRAVQLTGAARGAAVGSEAWAVATVAVADLESARSDAMISLGELDRLYAAQRIDGGDGGAIAAVRDQVTAWVADEDAVLADLAGRMRG